MFSNFKTIGELFSKNESLDFRLPGDSLPSAKDQDSGRSPAEGV